MNLLFKFVNSSLDYGYQLFREVFTSPDVSNKLSMIEDAIHAMVDTLKTNILEYNLIYMAIGFLVDILVRSKSFQVPRPTDQSYTTLL